MAQYTSKPVTVGRPAKEIYDRFADMTRMQEALEQMPAEQRQAVGEVQFTADSIRITTPQVGEISFEVKERQEPERIVLGTSSSPVPLTMTVDLKAVSPEATEVSTTIDVEIPAMLKPLIGPQLQKAADRFGELIRGLAK